MKSWIYFARYGSDGPIKIGRSYDPHERVANLACGTPNQLRLLGAMISERADLEEEELKQKLSKHCIKGEWFTAEVVVEEIARLGSRVVSSIGVMPSALGDADAMIGDLHIRLSPEELVAWKEAARREGLSLSQWMRKTLSPLAEAS